jgi:membrane-bound metal-dependent hydrolase YbcI (DUF457 family)
VEFALPVLGHAFVGLATGIFTKPNLPPRPVSRTVSVVIGLWYSIFVALAYLPDIGAQILMAFGWQESRYLTHSIFFAAATGGAVSILVPQFPAFTRFKIFLLTSLSIAGHDLLDLAQSTDRRPLWPIFDQVVRFGSGLIPIEPRKETLLFLVLFVAAIGVHRLLMVCGNGCSKREAEPDGEASRMALIGKFVVITFMMLAIVIHSLRHFREHSLETAHRLSERGEYHAVFHALEEAEGWPSVGKPGRIDYLKAEAYSRLGNRPQAEYLFLRSYRADPTYFWVVADLALFYASSDNSVEERRQRVSPLIRRLRNEFPSHEALPSVLLRIEQNLSNSDREDPNH